MCFLSTISTEEKIKIKQISIENQRLQKKVKNSKCAIKEKDSKIKGLKIKLKNFEAAVLVLSTINQAYSALNLPAIIGVLGGDILYSHRANINYKRLRLKLFK